MEIAEPEYVEEFGLEAGIHFSAAECREKVLFRFIHFIEDKFQEHGERVAQYPKTYIILALASVIIMMCGFFFFRQEKNPLNLWIPHDSDFYRDTHWLMQEYGQGLRVQTILITAPDVLQPDVLKQLLTIHTKLVNASRSTVLWHDVCFKVPVVNFFVDAPRIPRAVGGTNKGFLDVLKWNVSSKDSIIPSVQEMMTDESFDPSLMFGSVLYCGIVQNMAKSCLLENILDLWKFDFDKVTNLTKTKIVSDLDSTIYSPTLGHPLPFKTLLGGVTRDDKGVIVSAQALLSLYMVHVNFSTVNMDEVGNEGGTADWANGPGLEWESEFLKIMQEPAEIPPGMKIYYEAGRSFGDISSSEMFQDMDKLMIGIVLMLVYIQAQQTRTSCVQSRMIPSMIGLLSVGLAFLAAVGLCSLLDVPYGPVHTSLPFLLLGIGVDDMFVVYSCWNSLSLEDQSSPISKRMGLAMKHAGLSVTITSVTDAVAFLIGSSTILPSLHSFCLYAAVGVIVTFSLQTTLFIAVLAIDQGRIEEGRNCLIPCVRQEQPKLVDTDYVPHCARGFHYIYANFIITYVGKVLVVLLAFSLLGVAAWGNLRLRQEFRPEWFLDQRSYLYEFLGKRNQFFPDIGNSAGVYFGKLHYNEELQRIGGLIHRLQNRSDIVTNIDDWWSGFRRYVNIHFRKDIKSYPLSHEEFNQYISRYLFSPTGARFQKNFVFKEPLKCGAPAPQITVASIDFFFKKFEGSAKNILAMNAVKDLVKNTNFTSGDRFATVWAKAFANWVTDEVIGHELIRNVFLAVLAVAITTFILIGSALSSLWVLFSVVLTLFSTTGLMHFWGLTIDLVSCIALVLAVGLCVDFAAHIAYAFMSAEGTRDDRAIHAVSFIGGAVLHGGATTLLALSVLILSHSYIFLAFFKIFLLVIVIGLFHGLVFLPVVLSLLGPKSYQSCHEEEVVAGHFFDLDAAVPNGEEDNLPTPPERPPPEGRGL